MRMCLYAQIFSCFLPKVNLVRTSSWAKDNDDKSFSFDDSSILIKRGVLIHGTGLRASEDGLTVYPEPTVEALSSLVALNAHACLLAKLHCRKQASRGKRVWRCTERTGSTTMMCVALAPAGCLCKKTLGTAGGGLVHTVWNELGPDATRFTINNCQFTVNHWLLQHGMSIGIGDTVADVATGAKIGAIIDAAKEDVQRIIEQYQVGVEGVGVHVNGVWGLWCRKSRNGGLAAALTWNSESVRRSVGCVSEQRSIAWCCAVLCCRLAGWSRSLVAR
jgi:hypothetical protein